MAVAIYFSMKVPPSNPTVAETTIMTKTTSRALPREQVGRAPATLRGASDVQVGCVHLRRWVHSPRIGVLWQLNYYFKLHREFSVGINFQFFLFFCMSFGMNMLFL